MKWNLYKRIKLMVLTQAAKVALAVVERHLEKESPEQQERLLEVRRSLALMKRFVTGKKAGRSGRNRRRAGRVLVADAEQMV